MIPSPSRAGRFLAAGGLGLFLIACVTERKDPKTGLTYRDPAAPVSGGSAPVSLPSGPIAAPASASSTLTSRVSLPIVPKGQVLYDGLSLPLVSPDGTLIAVQQGDAPTWDALLAAPSAIAPVATHLAIYSLAGTTPEPIGLTELPEGVLLGRAADDRGFLVEWLRDDASRWIGRVPWTGGNVEWLVKGVSVCAHAVLTPQGDLVYTRAPIGRDAEELVLLRPDGSETVRIAQGGAFLLPQVAADGSSASILRATSNAMELEVLRIRRDIPTRAEWGTVLSRRSLASNPSRELAFQVMASAQGPMPARADIPRDRTVTYFDPILTRMMAFDPGSNAPRPLAENSFAAARWQEGYLCTTSTGLYFLAASRDESSSRPTPQAMIVNWPAIPRVLADARDVILIGPSPTRPEFLTLARLAPNDSAP